MDDLILGAVDGYDFYEVEPFLVSLRQTDFAGRLVLFAGPGISARTCRKMVRLGAEVLRFTDRFPFVADPHPDNVKRLPTPIHICNSRYFLYYDYLLKHGSRFRNVLITDVRDVVFQRNPFDFDVADSICVAMENSDIPIRKCPWTAPWVIAAFGQDRLEEIGDKEMSCSGTTLAPVPLMKRYLRAMLGEIAVMNSADAYLDQAAHNVLLHRGAIEPAQRLSNFEGPILTIGSETRYWLNEARELVNRDGSVIAVVHQYDRHAELARIVDARTRPSKIRRIAARTAFRFKKRLAALI